MPTPPRVARFLGELSKPGTTVFAAAAAIGVSSAAVYQRRGRDAEFAKAMDDARATARQATPGGPRWIGCTFGVLAGHSLDGGATA
ncbi:hypothetical protein [Streptomyces collinus]|uniref:hypothetical protein n=1 Tax=Streptomyces collinus TaxID=42684 RepID=UPI0036C5C465